MDCKDIKPVSPKENQSWIFIGRMDAEAETPILWPPDANCLIGKYSNPGKDWRQEKGMTEDEMVGWHHWLYGYEFQQALGVGDGQGSLVCCSPWGCRVRHDWVTELNCHSEQSAALGIKRSRHLLWQMQVTLRPSTSFRFVHLFSIVFIYSTTLHSVYNTWASCKYMVFYEQRPLFLTDKTEVGT